MMTLSSNRVLLIGGVLAGITCIAAWFVLASGPDHTPTQIVQKWVAAYPTDLPTAATITSWGMRDGLTAEKWIGRVKTTFADFRYLEGEVVSETVQDTSAEVLVDAKVSSSLGEQNQREQFRLSLVENQWVIDERSIVMVFPTLPSFF